MLKKKKSHFSPIPEKTLRYLKWKNIETCYLSFLNESSKAQKRLSSSRSQLEILPKFIFRDAFPVFSKMKEKINNVTSSS